MKFIATATLILLLMAQTFSTWFVVLAFNLNRDYIAKSLCENRYRPQLKCKGNCVLMKKMKEKEKQEQNTPESVKLEITSLVLSSRSFFATVETPVIISSTNYGNATDPGKPIDRSISFFHPPSA
ncbi:hypothetical protein [Terrimonas alba]|uniref:hypothetical protein n=1 Tax=Terrimonas alba TaxID=3349636 RepID=UPI0035F369C9